MESNGRFPRVRANGATRSIICIVLVLCLCWSAAAPAWAVPPIRVTFISPARLATNGFWRQCAAFMEVAARSLGMDLVVLDAEDRFSVADRARSVLAGKDKPDYLVFAYQGEQGFEILSLAEEAGVGSVIVNTDIIPEDRGRVGHPGTRFKHWLYHILPDESGSGSLLIRSLVRQAYESKVVDEGESCLVAGIGGSHETTVSRHRQQGLKYGLEKLPRTSLVRFVHTKWGREEARRKSRVLLDLYPNTRIFWSASDNLGLGVVETLREAGKRPGRDALVGGVDWTEEGLAAIERGDLAASVGGHFMEGAWALALLYDHHRGSVPPSAAKEYLSAMRLIEESTLREYRKALDPANWKKIDFKRFTRTHNPRLGEYNFSPDAVVRALK